MTEFPATRLSIIDRIRSGDDAASREALEVFVEDYRPALVDFLVKAKHVQPSDADDLVNDFILNKVMQGKVLDLANGQGRFRNALRACIQRYLIDGIRKRNREAIVVDTVGEEAVGVESDEMEIDPLDRVWAIAVFTGALSQMKKECSHWKLFVDRVLTQPPIGYDQIICRYGYENPQQASNALITAKRTFNRVLTANIEAQSSLGAITSAAEIEVEAKLLRVLLQDADLVRSAIDSLRDRPNVDYVLSGSGTTESSMTFVDPSADAAWEKQDLAGLFGHLLVQSIGSFAVNSTSKNLTLGKALDLRSTAIERADLIQLKEYFNARGKSHNSDLPRGIDVAMTFALTGRFILGNGDIAEITSMKKSQLVEGIEKLLTKPWLPVEVQRVYSATIRHFHEKH